jgi:hypothetical protein
MHDDHTVEFNDVNWEKFAPFIMFIAAFVAGCHFI